MPGSGGLATRFAPPLDLPFRFMATALAWLALLALLYPWQTPLLLGSFYDPRLTTFVHLNTLGVIAPVVLGASYQMLPVVLGVPIASVRLARLSWWLYLPALPLFLLGLHQFWLAPLAVGGTLLFLSLSLYAGIVLATLRSPQHRDTVYWHLLASVAGLLGALPLALLLAYSKGPGFLAQLTLPILAAHATLMLGGWVTPLLMGVAYRLVGMFTLSEDRVRGDWALGGLALEVVGAWSLAAGLLLGLGWLRLGGSLALLAGVAAYAAQLACLYRVRRRRGFDVHIPFALASAAFGLASTTLLAYGLWTGRGVADPTWVAAGWLAIAGWAESPIQGFLYKIGTFLTWLHRYAPQAGLRPVPRLEELYGRRTAVAGWACWTAGVTLGALAGLAQAQPLAYASAGGLSAGALLFLANAVRVGAHWRDARSEETVLRPAPTMSQ